VFRTALTALTLVAALAAGPAPAQTAAPLARVAGAFTAAEPKTLSCELMFDTLHNQSDLEFLTAWHRDGPRSGSIELIDSGGRTVARYQLEHAWPATIEIGASTTVVTFTATDLRRLP
jgi:hypothetical protein